MEGLWVDPSARYCVGWGENALPDQVLLRQTHRGRAVLPQAEQDKSYNSIDHRRNHAVTVCQSDRLLYRPRCRNTATNKYPTEVLGQKPRKQTPGRGRSLQAMLQISSLQLEPMWIGHAVGGRCVPSQLAPPEPRRILQWPRRCSLLQAFSWDLS